MQEHLCQCQATSDEQGPTVAMNVEIPVALLDQLKEAATLEGSSPEALLLCYARQGLLGSGALLKRGKFVEHARGVLEGHGVQADAIEAIFSKFLY
ncbi:hypothetical protein ACUUL3_10105 [Thiovibrio sp. JS02]